MGCTWAWAFGLSSSWSGTEGHPYMHDVSLNAQILVPKAVLASLLTPHPALLPCLPPAAEVHRGVIEVFARGVEVTRV